MRTDKKVITNPFYCGNNGELNYAFEDKANRVVLKKLLKEKTLNSQTQTKP